MALCSRMKTVVKMARPSHQFPLTPAMARMVEGSKGTRPSGLNRTLPPSLARTIFWSSSVLPYTCEASHQCVSVLA